MEIAIARLWRQAYHAVGTSELKTPQHPQALLEELLRKVDDESVSDADFRSFSRERLKCLRTVPAHRAARVRQRLLASTARFPGLKVRARIANVRIQATA